jgi:hypothetical protein
MADAVDVPERVRGPGFPLVLALTWALLLTATVIWSLNPRWWLNAEGERFFRDPESGAPTKTFEMLARVGILFTAVVWPMFLLKRGFWRPKTASAAARTKSTPGRRPISSAEWIAVRAAGEVDELGAMLGPPPPDPPAPPPGLPATASGELLVSGSTTFSPLESSAASTPEPTDEADEEESDEEDEESAEDSDDEVEPASTPPSPAAAAAINKMRSGAKMSAVMTAPAVPAPVISPRPDRVGFGGAFLQFVVLILTALPFWAAASYLSDVAAGRLVETAAVIASFGLLHVGYAAATRGWVRPPDRFYMVGVLLLTLGWAWLNRYCDQFLLPGIPGGEAVANFCPLLLVERVAVTGLPTATVAGDTTTPAAFWPAGAGVLLFLASFVTAKD